MVTLAHHVNMAQGAVMHGWLFRNQGSGPSSAGWIWKKRRLKEKGLLDGIKGVLSPPRIAEKVHNRLVLLFVLKQPLVLFA